MIVVTGAAGFIGSNMARKLNRLGRKDIVLVDDFRREEKAANLDGLLFRQKIQRENFVRWLERNHAEVEVIIHLGARTDTVERSSIIFDELNLHFSQAVWMLSAGFGIPLLYASSAATYGAGEHGYDDDSAIVPKLKPLNAYGQSKQDFDVWALAQKAAPPSWAGFKFFNVYGPGEAHKGRMASVVFHTFQQVKRTGEMRLFRSHRPDFADGEQARDFVFVEDVVDVLAYFMEKKPQNGIFNLGTGRARTYRELAQAVFRSMGLEPKISFIDTPEDIRENYQYFTEARMERLRAASFKADFTPLESGVEGYVSRLLSTE